MKDCGNGIVQIWNKPIFLLVVYFHCEKKYFITKHVLLVFIVKCEIQTFLHHDISFLQKYNGRISLQNLLSTFSGWLLHTYFIIFLAFCITLTDVS